MFRGIIRPEDFQMKSVTVAGFINMGKPNQANINIMMVKSLSTFLSKISKKVTPYKDIEGSAKDSGFWEMKELNSGKAINIAQQFSSEQVITGDYLVNDKSGKITIDVYVYNVINGQLLFTRVYKGDAGPEIFNTIDKMILDVSGLLVGKTISIGYFRLDIKPHDTKYRLFINDTFMKTVGIGDGYFDKFISGQSIDISLKSEKSDYEVFRKIIEIKSGATNELDFSPSGVLIIEAIESGLDVYLNGKKTGKTDSSGELTIPDVQAGKEIGITLKNSEARLSSTNIIIKEGATKVVVFKIRTDKAADDKKSEEIEVDVASSGNEINYKANIEGSYKFEITGGAYYIFDNTGYITKTFIYTNRYAVILDRYPRQYDYQIGSDEAEKSFKKAEEKAKGMSVILKLRKGDFVSLIPELFTGNIAKDNGKVYISVLPVDSD